MRFKSRVAGHMARVPVYTCPICMTEYLKARPERCLCGSEALLYFQSKLEASRYPELILMVAQGIIEAVECQPQFHIRHNGVDICKVHGDFKYFNTESQEWIVEDVKPRGAPLTRSFRLGRKLVRAFYGVDIVVVER